MKRSMRAVLAAWLSLLFAHGACFADQAPGFRAPEGFAVELFAGDELAHDIYCMTLDTRGRPVVSGLGYIKTLIDRDGDGRADEARLFAAWPPGGAHGLLADGDDLLVSTGTGLYRLTDTNGDARADGPPQQIARGYGGGDHSSNGIVKGPDGWFWWIHGNDAGINREHVTSSRSPVRDVNCGAVVRLSPDGKYSEVFAHGFRNPYDLDFGPLGQLFTYDADGERVQHLPWYSPTRVFDIAQGMHHGWVLKRWQHAWNHAERNCDNVERLSEVGRGSPTGVVVYRHRQFPERYRGGIFAMCWSKGRVYHLPLTRRGSTFDTKLEVFLETRGDVGFAPVDLAVGPTGDLYIAIGGRGTRGSVFRVRYAAATPEGRPPSPLRDALRADQPFAAWSRAHWVPLAKKLGQEPFEQAALDEGGSTIDRIRAIEILVELFGGISAGIASRLSKSADVEVAARGLWAVSLRPSPEGRELVVESTHHRDARILRVAWEAIGRMANPLVGGSFEPDWLAGLANDDRRVRAATVLAARSRIGRGQFEKTVRPDSLGDAKHLVGWLRATAPPRGDTASPSSWFEQALRAFTSTGDASTRLDALRMVVRGLGDVDLIQDRPRVTDGYSAKAADQIEVSLRTSMAETLAAEFPSGHRDVDLEIMRTIAMLDVDCPMALSRMTMAWRPESSVEDDIHYILAAGRIGGSPPPEFGHGVASAFASLHRKMREAGRETSRFWPTRVAAAYRQLRDKVDELDRQLVADPLFGSAEHTLFLSEISNEPSRNAAIEKLLATAVETRRWTTDLVHQIGRSGSPKALTALRELWGDAALRDSISLVLSARGLEEDRGRLIESLTSPRSDVVRSAARALVEFDTKLGAEALLDAMIALRRFCSHPRETKTRVALARLLTHASGAEIEVRETADGSGAHESYAPWFDWFATQHPEEARVLAEQAGENVDEILGRISKDLMERADARRGETVFRARGCHGCHRGARRLGPDLDGVASRLSKRDLLTAIFDPDRDISPAFVATEVVTRAGAVHRGLMVYQSPAATLMQTTADATVRFSAKDVVILRKTDASFMPRGLLSGLKHQEIADLLDYLKTLEKR